MPKCPIMGKATYLDCQDCGEHSCKKPYSEIVIGIDQSYANTGISIVVDGKLRDIKSIRLDHYKTNTEKRQRLSKELNRLLSIACKKAKKVVCLVERARTRGGGPQSANFINVDAIKAMGALTAIIVDGCALYDVAVLSVDTRAWKSAVVGTSKPQANRYGVPDKKWPTVKWVIARGFEDKILIDLSPTRKSKGTFIRDGHKYQYNDDAADSAGIAMFWVKGDRGKLKEEH